MPIQLTNQIYSFIDEWIMQAKIIEGQSSHTEMSTPKPKFQPRTIARIKHGRAEKDKISYG